MNELDILMHAKDYIDQLAQGIDPISGREVPEDSVINQARLVRCFFYVSGVLQQVIDNGGVNSPKPRTTKKLPFELTDSMRDQVLYSAEPVYISFFVEQLNNLRDKSTVKKLSTATVTNWLVEKGFLYLETDAFGKVRKYPTEAGKSIGISQEVRSGEYNDRIVVLYNEDAQHFIIDHMEDILHPIEPELA